MFHATAFIVLFNTIRNRKPISHHARKLQHRPPTAAQVVSLPSCACSRSITATRQVSPRYPRSGNGSMFIQIAFNPSARMFFAAFTSLSCSVPQCEQVHFLTFKSLVPSYRSPHEEQIWLLGKNLSTTAIFFPYHSALYSNSRLNSEKDASATDFAK